MSACGPTPPIACSYPDISPQGGWQGITRPSGRGSTMAVFRGATPLTRFTATAHAAQCPEARHAPVRLHGATTSMRSCRTALPCGHGHQKTQRAASPRRGPLFIIFRWLRHVAAGHTKRHTAAYGTPRPPVAREGQPHPSPPQPGPARWRAGQRPFRPPQSTQTTSGTLRGGTRWYFMAGMPSIMAPTTSRSSARPSAARVGS